VQPLEPQVFEQEDQFAAAVHGISARAWAVTATYTRRYDAWA
jgi:hypothetical protein